MTEKHFDVTAFQVAWYRKNGKYPKMRIRRADGGRNELYVVGDWSWNRNNPQQYETIESAMDLAQIEAERQP